MKKRSGINDILFIEQQFKKEALAVKDDDKQGPSSNFASESKKETRNRLNEVLFQKEMNDIKNGEFL
jgi:hypothetical protein